MIEITDDVIRDLLPLVQAGEASADTRGLVEAYLATHPALADEARRATSWALPTVAPSFIHAAEPEREALRRTQGLLTLRSWSLAAGIFFTALPFSFGSDGQGVRFLWLTSNPWGCALSLGVGLVAWIVYLRTSRRLRPAGF